MSDLKDKIFGILFEDETDETVDDVPVLEPKKVEAKPEIKAEASKPQTRVLPSAHDILYGKPDAEKKSSAFINYFEPINTQTNSSVQEKTNDLSEAYELKENISPIFGAMQEKAKKKKPAPEKVIQKATTNNGNEYVNIVLSPIFGYDEQRANNARSYFEQENEELLEENIEPAFDFPEISKNNFSVAKDAMYESLPELDVGIRTPKEEESLEKEIYEEPKVKATRSIYDSQPINLFDFDAMSAEDDTTKDLFDELVGDDK